MRIARIHNLRENDDHDNDSDQKDYSEVVLDIKPESYHDDMEIFDDPKELHKFVVRTKFLIRHSNEYEDLMKFLKYYKGMNCCGVHNNIKSSDGFQLHIHHTPLTIEDIIYIVVNKRIKRNESLKQCEIAKEIMELHYLGLVGLYPLCETCHEYAHGDTNDLFIPLDSIYGNPVKFFEIYDEYISDAMKDKFANILELNKGYSIIERNIPDSLMRKYIYVKTKGQEVMSQKALYDFIIELNK